MGVGAQCHTSAAVPLGKTQYSLYRRLGGSQVWSGCMRLHWGFNPWTIQSVASHYTKCAILAPLLMVQY
jgi:hypothetical protein